MFCFPGVLKLVTRVAQLLIDMNQEIQYLYGNYNERKNRKNSYPVERSC